MFIPTYNHQTMNIVTHHGLQSNVVLYILHHSIFSDYISIYHNSWIPIIIIAFHWPLPIIDITIISILFMINQPWIISWMDDISHEYPQTTENRHFNWINHHPYASSEKIALFFHGKKYGKIIILHHVAPFFQGENHRPSRSLPPGSTARRRAFKVVSVNGHQLSCRKRDSKPLPRWSVDLVARITGHLEDGHWWLMAKNGS